MSSTRGRFSSRVCYIFFLLSFVFAQYDVLFSMKLPSISPNSVEWYGNVLLTIMVLTHITLQQYMWQYSRCRYSIAYATTLIYVYMLYYSLCYEWDHHTLSWLKDWPELKLKSCLDISYTKVLIASFMSCMFYL